MKKGKFGLASTERNLYEPDSNLYLLPGELETQYETKSNSNTGHFWKRRTSLNYIMEESPPVKISDITRRRKSLPLSQPKQIWQTSPRSTGSRPWSASTPLSSSSSSSSSHYSLRRKVVHYDLCGIFVRYNTCSHEITRATCFVQFAYAKFINYRRGSNSSWKNTLNCENQNNEG